MLRKKLLALGLVGITTFGTISGNTAIVLAAPTNAEVSDNMVHGTVSYEMNCLERFIKEGEYENAISLQKQLKDHLRVLNDREEDTTDLQKKFDKLSRQINLLKAKNKKIELLERRIENSTKIIYSLLNDGEYITLHDEFETLYKYMEKLSKYKPIDKALLNKVNKLEYRLSIEKKWLNWQIR